MLRRLSRLPYALCALAALAAALPVLAAARTTFILGGFALSLLLAFVSAFVTARAVARDDEDRSSGLAFLASLATLVALMLFGYFVVVQV